MLIATACPQRLRPDPATRTSQRKLLPLKRRWTMMMRRRLARRLLSPLRARPTSRIAVYAPTASTRKSTAGSRCASRRAAGGAGAPSREQPHECGSGPQEPATLLPLRRSQLAQLVEEEPKVRASLCVVTARLNGPARAHFAGTDRYGDGSNGTPRRRAPRLRARLQHARARSCRVAAPSQFGF